MCRSQPPHDSLVPKFVPQLGRHSIGLLVLHGQMLLIVVGCGTKGREDKTEYGRQFQHVQAVSSTSTCQIHRGAHNLLKHNRVLRC